MAEVAESAGALAALHSSNLPIRAFQNLFLVAFSIFLLPLDLYLLMSSYVLQILLPYNPRTAARRKPAFVPRTVLITGISTTKGVALARMFYQCGHDVIAAETIPGYLWPWGQFSKSVSTFYPLPSPIASPQGGKIRSESYFSTIRWIIREQKVSLWISCSEGVPAVFDAELAEMIAKDTICKAIHFDERTTRDLSSVNSLMQHLVTLGLPVPDSHSVSSRDQIHQVLKRGGSPAPKPYIIRKSNDEIPLRNRPERLRLPKRTVSETYEAVAKVQINAENPYVLQEEVTGRQYHTYTLIVANEVQTFVAFDVSTSMTYESLPSDSVLTQAMLRYIQEFARRSRAQLTGHLSFTFVVDEHATEKGSVQLLFAIDCKPRVTTGCILFHGREREVVNKYLQAGTSRLSNGVSAQPQPVVMPTTQKRYYWIGYDISILLCRSVFRCLTFQMGVGACARNIATFLRHVLLWKEATFEIWDPLPSFWLYHVYWPTFLLRMIWSQR